MQPEIAGYVYFLVSQPYMIMGDQEMALEKKTLLVSTRDPKAAEKAYQVLLAGEKSYAHEKEVPCVLDKSAREAQAHEAEQEQRAASLLDMVDVKDHA